MQRPLAQENWLGGQVRAGDRDGRECSQLSPLFIISLALLLFSASLEVSPRTSKLFFLETSFKITYVVSHRTLHPVS